jgi:serine/threonine-protein kinase SRPK3
MIALLGPPPPGFVARGSLRSKFFSDDGKLRADRDYFSSLSNTEFKGDFCAGIPIPEPAPLEHRLMSLEGEDRECFLRFMRKML